MKNKSFYALLLAFLFVSCKTINLEEGSKEEASSSPSSTTASAVEDKKEDTNAKDVKKDSTSKTKEEKEKSTSVSSEKMDVVIEDEKICFSYKPEIIPNTTYVVVKDALYQEEDEVTLVGKDAVRQSMEDSIIPLSSFVGGNSIFDYNENSQFPIFTKKSAMTTIILNDDEAMVDTIPFMSDTENWQVTGDVWKSDKGERQLIMIKPKKSGLETNMLIVTNKRLYHFVLYSTLNDYQPMVSFQYKTEPRFITSHTVKDYGTVMDPVYGEIEKNENISFNYELVIPLLQKKVSWVPLKVYDDKSHTYIVLPESTLENEVPTVYEGDDSIINYTIHPTKHNVIILNKLISKATLRLGREKVIIKKKE